ncbi:hypothetical protein A5792_16865 [Mycolicibacterium peregrinum]|uniref:Uncharacterized protein n=1 Tax=Mycolicibacterium peregrinum TaxID=43304 RepID=A0A1A0R992_MYCPR|nr:hypothetical protein A5792_16865 [Mycolicibacterium peregrinum]
MGRKLEMVERAEKPVYSQLVHRGFEFSHKLIVGIQRGSEYCVYGLNFIHLDLDFIAKPGVLLRGFASAWRTPCVAVSHLYDVSRAVRRPDRTSHDVLVIH